MVGPNTPPEGSGKDDSNPINFDDTIYIHPSDNATTTIVTLRLTGNENFRLWRSCDNWKILEQARSKF